MAEPGDRPARSSGGASPEPRPPARGKTGIIVLSLVLILSLCLFFFRKPLGEMISLTADLLSDRDRIQDFVLSFGPWAPGVFILMQVLQVIFAPVPGEATGFIGGYLFGPLAGFVYSSIGLSLGSWINFALGRLLGAGFVRRLLPDDTFRRYDSLLRRQGVLVLFILFLFPGFPKDYLCLLLGLSALPVKLFLIIATFGRMPGTLALSLQGAALFTQNYLLLGILGGFSIAVGLVAYRYREAVYRWAERFNDR